MRPTRRCSHFPSVWPVRTLRIRRRAGRLHRAAGPVFDGQRQPLAAGTWAAAKASADAAASAAGALLRGERATFCATRPPGHHAGPDFMGGYCFINNAAVCAQALRQGGAARVAVLDVDYHHGNGTQAIFYDRAGLCCSPASTATRAPNTRSTWATPTRPARAPAPAST